uniref:Uncharacterized protein n=2 Tax=Cucumis melo TaxID=3656 RepID=A0A9I9DTJ5_CUCME
MENNDRRWKRTFGQLNTAEDGRRCSMTTTNYNVRPQPQPQPQRCSIEDETQYGATE